MDLHHQHQQRRRRQHHQRPTVVQGRLVYDAYPSSSFSWLRCIVMISLVLFLIVTNPANHDATTIYPPRRGQNASKSTNAFIESITTMLSSWGVVESSKFTANTMRDWFASATSTSYIPPYAMKHMTNFGLFTAVHDHRLSQVILSIGGFHWYCPYDTTTTTTTTEQTYNSNFNYYSSSSSSTTLSSLESIDVDWLSTRFCDYVRRNWTHQRPLLYDNGSGGTSSSSRSSTITSPFPNDHLAYTAHRILVWSLVGSALIAFCCTSPIQIYTRNIVLDSMLCFWFDTNREWNPNSWPLVSATIKIVKLNLLVYPSLQAMQTMIGQQSRDSIFSYVGKSDEVNYALSLLALFLIATTISVASKLWSGKSSWSYLYQFDAVTAVAMGYYMHCPASGILSTTMGSSLWTTSNADEMISFSSTMTWAFLILMALRGSITTVIFWCFAHVGGQSLFQYQYDHLIVVSTYRAFSTWLDTTSRNIEQFIAYLFAPPARTYRFR